MSSRKTGDIVKFASIVLGESVPKTAVVREVSDTHITLEVTPKEIKTYPRLDILIVKPILNPGDLVRTTQMVHVYYSGDLRVEKDTILCVLNPGESNTLVCPIDQMENQVPKMAFEMRASHLWPVVEEFMPGSCVIVGDSKREAKIIAVDVDGVVIEYKDPVGTHSYDGMGKSGHCDIVSKTELELVT